MKYIVSVLLFCLTFSVTANTLISSVVIDTVLIDENVAYKITHDENKVYVNVSTSDRKTIMTIMRLGVSVFFDVKGKKKQNVYIKYPLETMPHNRKGNNRTKEELKDFEEDRKNRKLMIQSILENNYSQKAEYGYFDDSQEFNILLNTLDVNASFTYDENEGLFEYNLQLPKALINSDSKVDLEKLTVGVMTIKEKRESNKNIGLSGNLGGVSLGSQQGGGRQGGGRQGGGRKGGGQGGPPNSKDKNKTNEVMLDFWFEANLK